MTASRTCIPTIAVCLSLLPCANHLHAQDTVNATQRNTETVAVDVLLQQQALLSTSAKGEALFVAGDYMGKTGDPALPVLLYHVLLPPDVDYSTLDVQFTDCRTNALKGTWTVGAVPPVRSRDDQALWPDGLDAKNPRSAAYGQDVFLPVSHLAAFRPFPKRQWRMVEIQVRPFRYNAVSGQLLLLESFRIAVSFARHSRPTLSTRSPAMSSFIQQQVRQLAVNFNEVMHEYGVRKDAGKEDAP